MHFKGKIEHVFFGFFAFTPVGLVMLGVGLVFMLTVGRRLLPDPSVSSEEGEAISAEARSGDELVRDYELHDNMESAITREKRLKKWNLAWKQELVEQDNPEWNDLWKTIL